jgi:hypothetical protein
MKYYKLIGNGYRFLKKGNIYPADYLDKACPSVMALATDGFFKEDWQEVWPCEYWMQEGRLPEKWYINDCEDVTAIKIGNGEFSPAQIEQMAEYYKNR